MPVTPALWEAEAGGSLEPRSSRKLSSLGNMVKAHFYIKKKKRTLARCGGAHL